MLKYILISFLIITNVYAYTCEEMGYTKSIADCPDGGLKCPAQPEKMFCCSRCGDGSGFRYNEENCSADDGLQLAGIECGGGWTECRQCTSEYKYNKDNCRSPKILAGVQCGNSYTQCIYPVGSGCVPTAGYIYYADGSCHADYDNTKEPIGIIVDASKKIIIALDEPNLPWNDGYETLYDIPELKPCGSNPQCLLDMDGQGNTDKIVAFALTSGQEHKAAQYCANKTEGNKKWYLPALGELNAFCYNKDNINQWLSNAPNTTLIKTPISYWSSSGEYQSGAYMIGTSNCSTWQHNKRSIYQVRCFAKF